jgi:hypothetical protein
MKVRNKKMEYKQRVIDYLPEFIEALKAQLEDDQKRWGDTWKQRPIEGQEDRIFEHIASYWDQYRNANVPVPWLKVAGLALIAWIRESERQK